MLFLILLVLACVYFPLYDPRKMKRLTRLWHIGRGIMTVGILIFAVGIYAGGWHDLPFYGYLQEFGLFTSLIGMVIGCFERLVHGE